MNSKLKTLIAAAGLIFAIGGAASSASAADWQNHHPRRAEINARLDRQNLRIQQERRMHVLTAYEARRLHMADRRVRMDERNYALHHGGRVSRAEQMRLNRRENRISHRIG